MCGICGILYSNKDKTVNRETLIRMNSSLIHRGPDEEGYFVNKNVGLGMRRLSIIDVKGGHQPIYNENKTVCIISNGEIYNYLELREYLEKQGHHFSTNSDTEVIVHLYEEDAEGFMSKLRGMFAIAIYDLNKDKLVLVKDRIGIKPLYYSYQNGVFLFASEPKAILKYPDVEKELSPEALSDYLTFLYIPSPQTIFKEIFKLPPAHILTISDGNMSLRQYWQINYSKQRDYGEEYYTERLKSLLKETIRMHLISEVPLGAFLSGGMDSSTIVALMSEIMNEPVKTFSVGFDVSGFNELKYARLVAERFKTDHYEINLKPDIIKILPKLISQFDEPFADSSAIPTYLISEFAKAKVTVCLAGDGGDELFAGYSWTRRQKFIEDYNRLPYSLRNFIKNSLLKNKDYFSDRKNKVLDKIRRFVYDSSLPLERSFLRRITCFSENMKKELFREDIFKQIANFDSASKILSYFDNKNISKDMEKLLFFDTKIYLPDDGLCKVDRMSMMNSLEVRVPFLDHKVVEFVASIPFKYKMRGQVSKYILKKVMHRTLPTAILKQRKLGFTIPLNSWFRTRLRNMACDVLLSQDCRLNMFFKKDFIKRLIEEHSDGRQNFGNQIFALLVLELWLGNRTP